MNLQQLNHNGQNLWVFIVTGVIALLITGASWFCVEVITSYKGWPREGSTEEARRNEGLAFRLALLVWLIKNGYTTWMWYSGAWLRVLSNDKLGIFRVRVIVGLGTERSDAVKGGHLSTNACDYVHRGIQSGEGREHFSLRTLSL